MNQKSFPIECEEESVADIADKEGTSPDGGFGWLVVFGCFLVNFVVLGVQYTYGIYQEYYYTVLFQKQEKISTLSLVGTLSTTLTAILGIFTGRLIDRYGYRTIASTGAIFLTAGLIAASFANKVWHLYLSQGMLYGVGASLCFYPAVSLPSQWFDKRRGLATGMAIAGTGVGGLALGPLTRKLIDIIGVEWTLRAVGVGAFIVLALAIPLLRSRLAPPPRSNFFNMELLTNKYFQVLFSGGLVVSLGYLIPFFYIPSYAVNQGLASSDGALIIGIVNATGAVGRIAVGSIADKVGRVNMIFICVLVASLDVLIFWNLAHTFGTILSFGMIYSFFAGGYIGLIPVVTAELFGISGIATSTGLVYASTGIGYLIGVPVAGAILDSTAPTTNYKGTILFGGFSMLVAAALLFTLRVLKYGFRYP
ncbi:hypothetical protein K7432_004081 [Basidiobolus ranarum]|uniref:Major facilitator superfamily (MFS) profile domain-containing protein n=1 Tax=Basidiobolus ranarum TaxID=34480 RepID=A0ABR2W609_9FUNG